MTAKKERTPGDAGPASRPSAGPERLRVLLAADTYPPDVNGAAYFTYRLATGLAERGHDVHVVCASATGRPGIEYEDGVVLHRLRSAPVVVHPTMRTAVPLGVGGHVARIVERLAPHVVHAQSHFTVSRAAVRRARLAGAPVVLTNHFMPDNLFAHAHIPSALQGLAGGAAWRDMVRVAYEADHVTTPTRRAADLLSAKGFSRTVEPVSCGIDLERFRPRPEERAEVRKRLGLDDRDTMVFVGRLDEEKRIDELIRALAVVRERHDLPRARAGPAPRQAELAALADELGVADRVRFLGFVPDEELPLAYVAANLFAIGSVAELQSIATLEAMATGLPVVAADALALPHLVDEGGNGFLYPPGDTDALAGRLLDVLGSDRREAMGEASRALALTHDHRRSLDRFEEIYRSVRPRRPGAAAADRGLRAVAGTGDRRRPAVAA